MGTTRIDVRAPCIQERFIYPAHVPEFAFSIQQSLCHWLLPYSMELKGYTLGDFDRGAPRWKEALWFLVKCAFFETPWPWPSALRVSLLRAFGARVGKGVVIRGKVNITFPWRVTVSDHVWIGEEVVILSLAPVVIESNVCISQRAFLCTGSHKFHSPGFTLVAKPITIRQRSWIAAQVFIAPGIEIGPDSMACAGSVVLQNVAPGTVVAGNPAVVIRKNSIGEDVTPSF